MVSAARLPAPHPPERKVVSKCLDHCYPVVSEWSAPLAYQHPIRLTLQGIEVPVIGFIDLRYVNVVRELKSSGKPRRGIVDASHPPHPAGYRSTGHWFY